MSRPRRLVTGVLATGAGLLMTASVVGCAPDADPPAVRTGASSTVEESPASRGDRVAPASRTLPQSGRRAVPPLKFPGFAASYRVADMPDDVRRAGDARVVDAWAPLPSRLVLRPAVWTPPPLPWA